MIEIRSYRRVFELERRIYRIDRLRLNPSGVPVRGVVYFLALLGASLIAGSLPLLKLAAGLVPWYLRAIVLPGLTAALLAVVRLEGRPFHLAAVAVVRHWTAPATVVGLGRPATAARPWLPADLLMLPDGTDARMRRLRYRGPGTVALRREHEPLREVQTRLRLRPSLRVAVLVRERSRSHALQEARVIVLSRNARLECVPRAGARGRAPGGGLVSGARRCAAGQRDRFASAAAR